MDTQRRSRGQMTLMEHFGELKRRLYVAALGVILCAVAGWFLFDPVFNALQQPLIESAQSNGINANLNFGSIASGLDFRFKIAGFIGLFISSPLWLYQLWAFITPGLTRKEKVYTYGFLGAAIPLFVGGGYFAWWILPRAVYIMSGFVPESASGLIAADSYLNFVMRLIITFGIACAMPVLLVALNFIGIVSAKGLLGAWRWAIVAAFTFSALMTPTPDALTMILVALPIVVLYFGAVGVAALHDRIQRKRDREHEEEIERYLKEK